jgi:hypothetical protein
MRCVFFFQTSNLHPNKHFELCCFVMYRVRNIVNRRESDVICHSVRRSQVPTSMGLKKGGVIIGNVLGNTLGTCRTFWELYGNILRTSWEHIWNLMGTHKLTKKQFPLPLPPPPKITIFLYLFFQCIAVNIES